MHEGTTTGPGGRSDTVLYGVSEMLTGAVHLSTLMRHSVRICSEVKIANGSAVEVESR